MKIKFIEIEATSEDLKNTRTLSDVFYDALCAVGNATRKMQSEGCDEGEEAKE